MIAESSKISPSPIAMVNVALPQLGSRTETTGFASSADLSVPVMAQNRSIAHFTTVCVAVVNRDVPRLLLDDKLCYGEGHVDSIANGTSSERRNELLIRAVKEVHRR